MGRNVPRVCLRKDIEAWEKWNESQVGIVDWWDSGALDLKNVIISFHMSNTRSGRLNFYHSVPGVPAVTTAVEEQSNTTGDALQGLMANKVNVIL